MHTHTHTHTAHTKVLVAREPAGQLGNYRGNKDTLCARWKEPRRSHKVSSWPSVSRGTGSARHKHPGPVNTGFPSCGPLGRARGGVALRWPIRLCPPQGRGLCCVSTLNKCVLSGQPALRPAGSRKSQRPVRSLVSCCEGRPGTNEKWRVSPSIPTLVLAMWEILEHRKTAFTRRAEGVQGFLSSKKKKKGRRNKFFSHFFFPRETSMWV